MDDYQIICSEKNIILKKDENNLYYLDLEINESSTNEHTIYDIISNDAFFDLLFELNNDIVIDYSTSDLNNNYKNIIYKLNLSDVDDSKNENMNLIFNVVVNTISDNKCSITSNNDSQNYAAADSDNIKNCFLDSFTLFYEKNDVSKLSIQFKLDHDDMIKNYFISMYLKKIFYKFKKYFE